MAARKNKLHPDPEWVERARLAINSNMLLKVLQEHIEGKRQLKNTQVRAAEILLRKTMPDLSATDAKTETTVSYVARTPKRLPENEWQEQHAGPLKNPPSINSQTLQ